MIRTIALGIGAGLIAALLFSVVVAGSPAGMLLCYVAPVPVLIVALGWTPLSGLLAASIGAAALSHVLGPRAGLAFAFGSGFPAWLLAYLVLLGRPGERRGSVWYPVGRLLVWVGGIGAFVALASTVALGRGDAELFRETLRQVADAILHVQLGVPANGPLPPVAGIPGADFVSVLVGLAPAVAGSIFALAFALNVWIAAKAVSVSGRLPRPWPHLAGARMPAGALVAAGAAALLAFGPGYAGIAGAALLGGLGMAFALQGLALVHEVTRGRTARGPILGLVYFMTIFFGATVLPLLALAGIADSALPIRQRFTRPRGPEPTGRPPV